MHTIAIILKTFGTVGFCALALFALILTAEDDTLGTVGPSRTAIFSIIFFIACAVGVWFI